jgi:nitrite reductase/ring-hydroxylating ferredoxin subunit
VKKVKVKAEPVLGVFGSTRNYHFAWSAICPHCEEEWESMDTTCDKEVFCNECGETFTVEYPVNCGLSTFFSYGDIY